MSTTFSRCFVFLCVCSNGTGVVMDVSGTCCATLLDASGHCCVGGAGVDDCGVCNGAFDCPFQVELNLSYDAVVGGTLINPLSPPYWT